jgi:pimeloyl-ACP methyl ester carboxylesterase
MQAIPLQEIHVHGRTIAYRELGHGEPVLLLHGWPTSSFLWREVMRPIARETRVIALDLPGFGASDKPLDVDYSFAFFDTLLDAVCAELGVDSFMLGVHDLGGPIGLHWALSRLGRLRKLALLNTLVYPEFSPEILDFIQQCASRKLRDKLTSPAGLEALLREGVHDPRRITPEFLDATLEPFRDPPAREALARTALGLSQHGFFELAKRLPELRVPVQIVIGERDRLLPDVAQTMARVQRDVAHARASVLPDCGHFLQEEAPEQVGELLAKFFQS